MIVKIAYAKKKGKKLVPWIMSKMSNEERQLLEREMEVAGHKGTLFLLFYYKIIISTLMSDINASIGSSINTGEYMSNASST